MTIMVSGGQCKCVCTTGAAAQTVVKRMGARFLCNVGERGSVIDPVNLFPRSSCTW